MERRTVPQLDARSVAAGLLLSFLVSMGASLLGFQAIVGFAGAAAGGALAARLAGRDGPLHGAAVGVGDVLALAIATGAADALTTNVVADTAATVISDALLLLCATAGGWLAGRRGR